MSHRIVRKQTLSPDIFLIEVEAAHIAERFEPGQFVILRLHELGERIPLTVADVNRGKGTVTLIFQAVGKTTMELSRLEIGDELLNCVGPLGNPTEIRGFGRVICVGGGTGIACIYPIVKALARAGNTVISIIGARTASGIILEEGISALSTLTRISTDDGSRGHHGLVTEVLADVLEKDPPYGGTKRVFVIGPPPMMRAVAEITRPAMITTIASLNTIMVDGTGMCGCCRVFIDGKMKLACIDGPEFDAHKVDFDDVIRRLDMFRTKEKEAVKHFRRQKSKDGSS